MIRRKKRPPATSKARIKFLRKLWARLWLSDWSNGEHLAVLNHVVFEKRK